MSEEKNSVNNNGQPSDNAPTIIGKDAKDIITAASDSSQTAPQPEAAPEIIDIALTQKIEPIISGDTEEAADSAGSDPYIEDEYEDDFTPVLFSREDIVDVEKENEEGLNDSVSPDENLSEDEQQTEEKHLNFDTKIVGEFLKKARKPLLILICAAAAVFIVLYIICMVTLPTDLIARNVYIESLYVGGLTYDEALASVNATYLFEDQTVTLRCEGESFSIDGLDIGLSASPEETTQKAFNYAKTNNKILDAFTNLGLIFHRHTVVPVASINQEKLDEKLWEFGVKIYGERVGHYIEVRDDNESTIWPGHTGFDNDVSVAREEILTAFDDEQFSNIHVTLKSAPPDDVTVEQYDLAVYKDPVDARYEVTDGEIHVIPEETGRYIDKEQVAPMLAEVKEGSEPVIVPWETSYADITAETLQAKLFADVLASYSTYYGSSTANRSANVARASSLMNGAILGPGDIFSFNDRVGKRTTYNGFYTAPEYVNGQTVEGIGGGTCQVSTTLYSAVLYAGLDIVSRTNHMFTVSYAPLGQDATVADGGVDFQFQNNTSYPIKIKSYTDGSSIYVDIIGTAWDPPREVKIDHSVSYGSGGTYVYSKRYIYQNGECIADEELPSSYYKTHSEQH